MTDEELRSTVITLRRLLSCIITVLFETIEYKASPALRFAACSIHGERARKSTLLTHRSTNRGCSRDRAPCIPTTPSTNTQCYTVTELIQGIALSFDPVARPHEGKFLTAERYFPKQTRRQFNFFLLPLVSFLLSSLPSHMIYDWEHMTEIKLTVERLHLESVL